MNNKQCGPYLLRCQAGIPILAGVGIILALTRQFIAVVFTKLIGGLIVFRVDQFIFTSQSLAAQWEVKENIICADCGRIAYGYRHF